MLETRRNAVSLSRRRVFRLGLIGGGAALLAACGQAAAPTPVPPKPTAPPKAAEPTKPTSAATKPAAAPTLAAAPTKPAAAPTLAAVTTPAAKAPAAAPTGQTLRMAFVPSSDSSKVLATGQPLGDLLGQITGYKFEVSVPTSYAAVIEAMGSGKVDIGWLAPFSYVIAHDKFGVDVILTTLRQGSKNYRSQIITHAEGDVKSLEDLKGKKFAFADPASASGFLYPAALLKEKGFDPKAFFSEVLYAGGHDKVVIAVYNKQVAGGATFGRSSNEPNAPLTDARTRVQSTLPDVLQKVTILTETDPIPNDTVSVRKDLEQPIVDKVKSGLLELAKRDDGKKLLRDLYQIDGLAEGTDADYEPIRRKAQLVGLDIEARVLATPAPVPAKPAATKPAGTPAAKP